VLRAEEIWKLGRRGWRDLLREGRDFDPSAIEGATYRGVSLGLPRLLERLTWTTFQKAFFRDTTTGVLRGWNVRLEQRGVASASVPRTLHDGRPRTFGHFVVVPPPQGRGWRGLCRGLLLDYGSGKNARFDAIRLLRDPIVQVNDGSADLLFGWSYVDLGWLKLPTPSYFTLEREGPVGYVP
jgi:hypothetical protein